MDILNMNDFAVHPRVIAPSGALDTVTVMAKRRTTLPEGYTVDANWLASMTRVSVYDDKRTRVPRATGTGTLTNTTAVAPNGLAIATAAATATVSSPEDLSRAIAAAQQSALAAAAAQQASQPVVEADPESN